MINSVLVICTTSRHSTRRKGGSPMRLRTNVTSPVYNSAAPPHSITSSARASSVGGTSMPSVLAVFRLITSLNLTGA
jgi:hypothetical protein